MNDLNDNLNDDSNTDHEIEALLRRLTPRSAPHDLRREVLQSVANQLASTHPVKQGGVKQDAVKRPEKKVWARWDFLSASAAATLLVTAACFNVWVCARQEQRLSQLYGPTPTPQAVADISEAIASVAGEEASRSFRSRLLAMRRRPVSFVSHNEKIRQLLDELGLAQKEPPHGEAQKNLQMDRDSRRGSDRDTSERERSIELESRFTA